MQKKKVKYGEIYYYDFGENPGSVQCGCRPVLIIQGNFLNENSPTTVVAAITSATKKLYLPSHIYLGERFGLKLPSIVMLEQSRTINQGELKSYVGIVNETHTLKLIAIGLNRTFNGRSNKPKQKSDVRCLCYQCLSDCRSDRNLIIKRLDPLSREKDKCDKCNRLGFDYVIINKSRLR